MSTLLIGLAGAARSGKSTAAAELAAQHGFIHYAFAQPLKAMLAEGLNLSAAQLEGAEKEAPLPWLGKSPRELLQTLGSEWGRKLVHRELAASGAASWCTESCGCAWRGRTWTTSRSATRRRGAS